MGRAALFDRKEGGRLARSKYRYMIFDGDQIGDHIAKCYLCNDESALRDLDIGLRQRMAIAEDFLRSTGCDMIACGADGITCKGLNLSPPLCCPELSGIVAPYTFSIGFGASLREAFICLRFAKASGRNRWAEMTARAP
jgi:hypothetical protein